MEIEVTGGDITKIESDAIILNYYENSEKLQGDLALVDKALEGTISRLISSGEIKGKYKDITTIYTLGKLPSPKVAVVGLGKKAELNSDKIRVAVAEVCKVIRQKSPQSIDSVALGASFTGVNLETVGQSITEGAMLGTYTFRKHVTKTEDNKEIRHFKIIANTENKVAALERGCCKGKIIAEAVVLARDMVNEPANAMTPSVMADIAAHLARQYNLSIKVLEQKELQQLGMGGLLGVAQGSQQPPKFIVLIYKGKDSDDLDIALVGKGITFDSGGISIKPSDNMGDMKGDMAGGASVIGAICAIGQLKPKLNVTAIVPATENLPGGTAMKPGDIITIMNGKTIEIISTDAEGRLILADGLSYAKQMGAKRLIDVATLTGACRIALGDLCTGALGNNQELIDSVIAAGAEAGECIWQLPLKPEYRELNKSDVADFKNSGGRYASTITAAWFLGEFTEGTPWVHLDIAGTSMLDKERGYQMKGATGVPVRTLINLVLSLAEKEPSKRI
jgi:leucyl aminopeptidase